MSFTLVGFLVAMQSVFTLFFVYYSVFEGGQFISPVPAAFLLEFIKFFFLAMGAAGLVLVPALLLFDVWGYYGTIALGFLTIAFDVWAVLRIDLTAFVGIIIPLAVIAYLIPRRVEFVHRIL